MINKLKSALRGFRIWILLVLSALGLISFRSVDDNYFELSRNLDIFTTVLRELSVYYVDPADPKQLVEEGIHSMLESLDPYTQFIPANTAALVLSSVSEAKKSSSPIHTPDFLPRKADYRPEISYVPLTGKPSKEKNTMKSVVCSRVNPIHPSV
jgi:hypothetical protein